MAKETGGAHLPHKASWNQMNIEFRSYAAIHLRIPDSGIDWLDKMIAKAERRDLAAQVFQAIHTQGVPWDTIYQNVDTVVATMLRAKGE